VGTTHDPDGKNPR